MKRKIVSCLLLASFSYYVGCYSTEVASKDELKEKVEQVDITIFTKDSLEYKFSKDNYRIRGDTLSGYGIRRGNVSTEVVLDARISFANIDSIETQELNLPHTILLCGGIGFIGVLIITLLFKRDQTLMVTPTYVSKPNGQQGRKN